MGIYELAAPQFAFIYEADKELKYFKTVTWNYVLII